MIPRGPLNVWIAERLDVNGDDDGSISRLENLLGLYGLERERDGACVMKAAVACI